MPSHPLDFQIQANMFSTPELTEIFDERTRFARWLQFEAALALSQGELGVIPVTAAKEIKAKAKVEHIDLDKVALEYRQSRNSLIPLLNGLRRACSPGANEYIHYGATTQDVLDTAQVLEFRDYFRIIYRDLHSLEAKLLDLSSRYQNTPMIGRTHGQQALPITFGLKTAVWLAEIRRHIERLKSLRPRLLVGQLSGAVGTMAALGPKAREVARLTMNRLGLEIDAISWHNSRDNIAEAVSFLAILSSTLAKVANEIFQLQKTEISELREAVPGQAMSSSSMPHKQNPVICERIVVLNRHVRALLGTVLESMVHEHERDARSLWSEWLAVPQICIYTGAGLAYLDQIVGDLEVKPERMALNLGQHRENICSEWLLFRLGRKIGKMKAQSKLYGFIQEASASDYSLREILAADEEIGSLLTPEDFDGLDHPETYIGLAETIIEETIAKVQAQQKTDPETF